MTDMPEPQQGLRVIENPADGTSQWRACVVHGEGLNTVVRAMFIDADQAHEYVALESRVRELEQERDRWHRYYDLANDTVDRIRQVANVPDGSSVVEWVRDNVEFLLPVLKDRAEQAEVYLHELHDLEQTLKTYVCELEQRNTQLLLDAQHWLSVGRDNDELRYHSEQVVQRLVDAEELHLADEQTVRNLERLLQQAEQSAAQLAGKASLADAMAGWIHESTWIAGVKLAQWLVDWQARYDAAET